MFSAGKMSGSAGEAARYYTRGDYYEKGTDEPGLWGGRGAEQLGLSGEVKKADLERVLDGNLGPGERTAWDGKKAEGERTTGYDFTFSPPKSVSIMALVAGDKRIIELQKEASAAGMEYIEKHAAVRVRTPESGIETKATGNLVYASFTETTSRELDPQLHTHNPIASATYDPDREGWYAVHWKETMKTLKAADRVALAHLAVGLQKLGYTLEVDQQKGTFEIAGQDPKLLEGMSKANNSIQAWIATKGDVGWDERRAHYTRNRADKQQSDEKAHEERWRQEVRDGYEKGEWANSPQELDKMRDAAIARPIELDARDAREALAFAIDKHIGREAVVPERQIVETALSFGMGKVDRRTLHMEILRQVKEGELLRPTGKTGETPLLYPLSTEEMYRTEKSFRMEIKRGQGKVSMLTSPNDADKALDKFRITSGDEKFPLNDEQKAAAKLVLTTKDRFTVVQGTAGAGKSEMVAAIMAATPRRTHLGVAPTGQALKELHDKTGIKTMTVQRLVMTGAREVMRGTIVYADEASMNDSRVSAKMARLARDRGFRIITIGDRDQLPAIGAGRPHEESLELAGSIARLDRSMRQREGSQASLVAATVKAGQEWQRIGMRAPELRSGPRGENPFAYLATVLGDGLQEFSGPDADRNRDRIAAAAAKAFVQDRSEKKGPVLVLDNKIRTTINEKVRSLLVDEGKLDNEKGTTATVLVTQRRDNAEKGQNFTYQNGDILVFNLAAKKYAIEKGERFKVTGRTEKGSLELTSLDRKGRFRTIDAGKAESNSIGVFRPEKRQVTVGDRIATTAKMGDVANASGGTVTKVKDGRVTFAEDKGRSTTLNLEKDQHWDHAYAMTFQKAQGATMENARVVLLESDAQLASARTLNSAVTRAKENVELYTDNAKDAIEKIAGRAGTKTSVLEASDRDPTERSVRDVAGRALGRLTRGLKDLSRGMGTRRLETHAELPGWAMRHVDGERYQLDEQQKELREREIEDLKAKGAPESEYRSMSIAEAKAVIAQNVRDLTENLQPSKDMER
jgi:conjugative relaxase-like TrwC/TraI family protein